MAEPALPGGGSVFGRAGFAPASAQPAQPAPGAAPQQGPIDTSGAVIDDDGSVWVKRGGEFFTLPKENLDKAANMPGLSFASPNEVSRVLFAEQKAAEPGAAAKTAVEQFGVGLANAVSAAGRGIGGALSAGAGYAGATDAEAALQDFARHSTGESLAQSLAYLGGGVEGEDRFRRAYQAREEAFPLTAGVARTAGLLVPAIATGGAAALAGGAEAAGVGLASRLAGAVLSPGGIQQAAIGGAVQGGLGGLAAPFETMEDTPISREAILMSGAMGAVLGGAGGGAFGAVAKYAPSALRRVFGRQTQEAAAAEVRASLPDAIQQMAEGSPEQRALYESIVSRGQVAGRSVHELADRIETAMAKAGPNPELRAAAARAATEAELERVARTGTEILPSEWRAANLSPDDMVRNRDVLKTGARNEISERLGEVLDESKGVMEHLRNFEVKRPLVAKNLADMTAEQETTAISNSLSAVRSQRGNFEKLFDGPDALKPNRATESLAYSLNDAEAGLTKAETAADAYLVIDKLRRETDKWIAPLTRQTTSTSAPEAFEGRALLQFTENQYESARRFLADSDTWGKQGLLQQKVNAAWADDIAAEGRVTKLGAFTSRDISDRYGRQTVRVDPDKIEKYLDGLGKKSLPDQDLQAMLASKAKLMREVAAAYEIPGDKVTRAIGATDDLTGAIKQAHEIMTASGGLETQLANILQSRLASIAGRAAGAVGGGLIGGVPGALVGHTVGAAVEEYAATKVPQIMQALTKNPLGFGKLPQVYQKSLNRQVNQSIPAFARPLFKAVESGNRAEQLEQYDKRTDAIARLASSPDALMAAAAPAVSRYDDVRPGMASSAQLAAQERIARLAANWPGKVEHDARGKAQTTASDQDLKLASAMWEATAQPMTTMDDFAAGKLDPDKAKWTWIQYPELQRLFQAATLDSLQSIPEDVAISHEALAQLDLFLGFGGGLDKSQSPAALALAMGLAKRQRAEGAAGEARPVSTQNFQTRTNRIMGMGVAT